MSFFNLNFTTTGTQSIDKFRNTLSALGQQSYKTFDAMSRSLSNIDKLTNRTLGNMTKYLAGGGILAAGIKTINYGLYQSNSMITTNKILMEEMIGSADKAGKFMRTIQDVSGSFGQDMTELTTASRGMVQMLNAIGKSNGGMNEGHLKKMLQLITTASMLDTENRGLAYTAFSFKEALQGIGAGDWRSMRNRLEINIGKPMEQAITKAVKAGDLDQVVKLFDDAFKRIGLNSERILKRLMAEGLTQNIYRSINYLNRTFQMLGESSYKALSTPFAKLNTFLSEQFAENTPFMNAVKKTSDKLRDVLVTPFNASFTKVISSFSAHFLEMFKGMMSLGSGAMKLFGGLLNPFISFTEGILGMNQGLQNSDDIFKNFGSTAEKIGKIFGDIGDWVKGLSEPIYKLGQSVRELIFAFGNLMGLKMPKMSGNDSHDMATNFINTTRAGVDVATEFTNKAGQVNPNNYLSDSGMYLNLALAGTMGLQIRNQLRNRGKNKNISASSMSQSVENGVANELSPAKWSQFGENNTSRIDKLEGSLSQERSAYNLNKLTNSIIEEENAKIEREILKKRGFITNTEGMSLKERMGHARENARIEKDILNLQKNLIPAEDFNRNEFLMKNVTKIPKTEMTLDQVMMFQKAKEFEKYITQHEKIAKMSTLEKIGGVASTELGTVVNGMFAVSIFKPFKDGITSMFSNVGTWVKTPLFAAMGVIGLFAAAIGTALIIRRELNDIEEANLKIQQNLNQIALEKQNRDLLSHTSARRDKALGKNFDLAGFGNMFQNNEVFSKIKTPEMMAGYLQMRKEKTGNDSATQILTDYVNKIAIAKKSGNLSEKEGEAAFGENWKAFGNKDHDLQKIEVYVDTQDAKFKKGLQELIMEYVGLKAVDSSTKLSATSDKLSVYDNAMRVGM